MANAVDENLKAFIQGGTPITAIVGNRIIINRVEIAQAKVGPYIFLAQVSADSERALDDAVGTEPFSRMFTLECWGRSMRQAAQLGEFIHDRLDGYGGGSAFGDTTVKRIFVTPEGTDYQPITPGGEVGLHLYALSVEVIP